MNDVFRENQRNARIFKAFCDENRLTILQLLADGEMCACKLQEALSIGQSTLSHHMRILCDAGMVDARRDGKWMHYSISSEGVDVAIGHLNALKGNGCACSNKSCCEK